MQATNPFVILSEKVVRIEVEESKMNENFRSEGMTVMVEKTE